MKCSYEKIQRHKLGFIMSPLSAYLGYKDKAKCDGGAENDKKTDDEVGCVLSVLNDEGDGYSRYTHDYNIVYRHTNILGVIEGRYTDLPGFPSQKTPKYLKKYR